MNYMNHMNTLAVSYTLSCQGMSTYDPAKVIYLNFHPLEVVDRGSETQLQVGENNSTSHMLGLVVY